MTLPFRSRFSAVRAQLYTLIGLRPRGFFIQYDHVASLSESVDSYPEIEELFRAKSTDIDAFIAEMASYLPVFERFGSEAGYPEWNFDMFPPRDGAAAYTAVRMFEPDRIIEIGSGNSTHFLSRAAQDCSKSVDFTCIDPAPRRPIAELEVNLLARILSDNDVDLCADLQANDILFIDSSHIMLPGMDLDILFNRVFPRLKTGVVVHLHDIFLPDDYPSAWRYRWYSEQNALVGWLVSEYFEVIYPGHYAATRHGETMDRLFEGFAPLQHHNAGSIWLQRT